MKHPDADRRRPASAPAVRGLARGSRGRAPFRVAGLDGVRAIAVTLVILFHLTPGTTIGGYLGVDIFFVVSGFLITSLLLRERDEHRPDPPRRLLGAPRATPAAGPRRARAGLLQRRPGAGRRRRAGRARPAGARRRDLQQQLAAARGRLELLRRQPARAVPQPLVARRRGAVLPGLAAAARAGAGPDAARRLAARRRRPARRRLGRRDGAALHPRGCRPASTTAPTPTPSASRSARSWRCSRSRWPRRALEWPRAARRLLGRRRTARRARAARRSRC